MTAKSTERESTSTRLSHRRDVGLRGDIDERCVKAIRDDECIHCRVELAYVGADAYVLEWMREMQHYGGMGIGC